MDKGWDLIDSAQLEDSLMHNVEACYYKIAQFTLKNVNDDMPYYLWFDNSKGLWDVAIIKDSQLQNVTSLGDLHGAEMTVEQRADFFKSETFKKIARRAYYIISDAKKSYDKIVKQHVENGELLDVDVIKLDAILHFIDQQYFLDNILNGKYLSY